MCLWIFNQKMEPKKKGYRRWAHFQKEFPSGAVDDGGPRKYGIPSCSRDQKQGRWRADPSNKSSLSTC